MPRRFGMRLEFEVTLDVRNAFPNLPLKSELTARQIGWTEAT